MADNPISTDLIGQTHILEKALEAATQGKPVREVAATVGLSVRAFYTLLEKDKIFAQQYTVARNRGCDALADDLLEIPHVEADQQKARLLSDNIKWILARRAADRYGDKLSIDVSGQVDLTAIMAESAKRLRPVRDLDIEDATLVPDKSISYAPGPLDKQSNAESAAPEDDDIFG